MHLDLYERTGCYSCQLLSFVDSSTTVMLRLLDSTLVLY